jgi:hypothetical protein
VSDSYPKEFWLHVPTFTFGLVTGQFIEFRWNGRKEESFFEVLKLSGEWVYIGDLT